MAQGGAGMTWLMDNPEVRADVRRIHPEAKRVIMLAVSYASDVPGYLAQPPAPDEGWIARYAQGRDYHHDVKRKAIALSKAIAADPLLGEESRRHRVFVEQAPFWRRPSHIVLGSGGWVRTRF